MKFHWNCFTNVQVSSICSYSCFAPNRRQATLSTSDGLFFYAYICHLASMSWIYMYDWSVISQHLIWSPHEKIKIAHQPLCLVIRILYQFTCMQITSRKWQMGFFVDMHACGLKHLGYENCNLFHSLRFRRDIYSFIGTELLYHNIIYTNYGNNVWLSFQQLTRFSTEFTSLWFLIMDMIRCPLHDKSLMTMWLV